MVFGTKIIEIFEARVLRNFLLCYLPPKDVLRDGCEFTKSITQTCFLNTINIIAKDLGENDRFPGQMRFEIFDFFE